MHKETAPIRVLQVASGDLWAGAESQVYELTSAMFDRADTEVRAVVLNDGELATRLATRSIPVTILPESRLSTASILLRLCKLAMDWRPHVIHTHRQKENVVGAIAATIARTPACLRTAHGLPEFSPSRISLGQRFFRLLDQFAAQSLQQCIVAVSDDLQTELHQHFPRARFRVISNGINPGSLLDSLHSRPPLDPNVTHVAMLARLVPVKRPDIFLEAASIILQSTHREYHFHIIGDGPLRGEAEKKARLLHIEKHCTFHGFVAEPLDLLNAMNYLLITSDHEGLPMALLEARCLGLPVVAHSVGGIPAVLDNDSDCILIDTHDAQSYADALLSLAEKSTTSRTCRLPPSFDIKNTSSAYIGLYRSLLSPSS